MLQQGQKYCSIAVGRADRNEVRQRVPERYCGLCAAVFLWFASRVGRAMNERVNVMQSLTCFPLMLAKSCRRGIFSRSAVFDMTSDDHMDHLFWS